MSFAITLVFIIESASQVWSLHSRLSVTRNTRGPSVALVMDLPIRSFLGLQEARVGSRLAEEVTGLTAALPGGALPSGSSQYQGEGGRASRAQVRLRQVPFRKEAVWQHWDTDAHQCLPMEAL